MATTEELIIKLVADNQDLKAKVAESQAALTALQNTTEKQKKEAVASNKAVEASTKEVAKSSLAAGVAASAMSSAMNALKGGAITLAMAGIAIALEAVYTWYNKASEAAKQMQKEEAQQIDQLNQLKAARSAVSAEAQKNYIDEKMKIDGLRKEISNTNLTLEQRNRALKALNEIQPEYIKNQTLESAAYGQTNVQIDAYLKSFEALAKAKAAESVLADMYLKQFVIADQIKTAAYEAEFNNILLLNETRKLGVLDALTQADEWAMAAQMQQLYKEKVEAATAKVNSLSTQQNILTNSIKATSEELGKVTGALPRTGPANTPAGAGPKDKKDPFANMMPQKGTGALGMYMEFLEDMAKASKKANDEILKSRQETDEAEMKSLETYSDFKLKMTELDVIKTRQAEEAKANIKQAQRLYDLQSAGMAAANIQSMLEEGTVAAKAVAIAQIGISTATAAIAALSPPPIGAGPLLGPLLAGTAIAAGAVAAAKIAGIGFEQGGIVPGNSYSGDQVRANVNSGEMWLTQSQQRTLFNLANGSGGGKSVQVEVIGYISNDVIRLANKRASYINERRG